MRTSAQEVAAEIRHRLPNVPTKKLHKLLYYCQGYHVAAFGTPLFVEPLEAWDMGPVVADLWRAERDHGPGALGFGPSKLDQGQLNTIGYVISRYGAMTGTDLERLTHTEPPWTLADQRRQRSRGQRIELDDVTRYFRTLAETDPEEQDEPMPDDETVRAWLSGAEDRAHLPASIDDLESLDSLIRP